jgi:predicted ester cyclase
VPHPNAAFASQEANKAVALRLYEEVINGEQKPVIDEICADDVLLHDPFTGIHRGVAAFKGLLGLFDAAFPHHRVVVERAIAEGDCVAVLHTHHATHTGPFMGLPPTGRSVVVNGLELFRFTEGHIVEIWRKDDDASLLIQLGLLAAPRPG